MRWVLTVHEPGTRRPRVTVHDTVERATERLAAALKYYGVERATLVRRPALRATEPGDRMYGPGR